jgi:hypothetical protein
VRFGDFGFGVFGARTRELSRNRYRSSTRTNKLNGCERRCCAEPATRVNCAPSHRWIVCAARYCPINGFLKAVALESRDTDAPSSCHSPRCWQSGRNSSEELQHGTDRIFAHVFPYVVAPTHAHLLVEVSFDFVQPFVRLDLYFTLRGLRHSCVPPFVLVGLGHHTTPSVFSHHRIYVVCIFGR